MVELTLPTAIAFVGSLAVLCLTLIKLITHRNEHRRKSEGEKIDDLQNLCHMLSQRVAVLDTKIDSKNAEMDKLNEKFDKLNDLLIKLFSENAAHE